MFCFIMKVTKSKVVIFSVAIAFISVLFFAYAIQSFYPAPVYRDFCKIEKYHKINNSFDCNKVGGKWNYDKGSSPDVNLGGRCDVNFNCQKEYNSVRELYERNVFFANLIFGFLVFIIAFFLGIEAVSSGLMGGAVMLIIYGSMRYWGELSDVWRTFMLGVALSALIFLGYKKLQK